MSAFSILENQEFIALSTFRKTGQAVATPVWFVSLGDKLYVWTEDGSGKTKRIRNNSQVTLAASDARGAVLGETLNGQARLLADSAEAKAAFYKKYGFAKRSFELMGMLRRAKHVYIEITPA